MKRLLITGCSRGIGLSVIKKLLSKDNIEIFGTSTSGKQIIKHSNSKFFALNLSDEKSIDSFTRAIKNVTFDYLINNAGVLLDSWDVSSIDMNKLEETFRVNLFGTVRLTENLISQINNLGHIINIASDWGSFSEHNFDEYQPSYKMSKAALNMYTKVLSKRLEKSEIKVSSFDPGWVQTDMGGVDANRTSEEVAKEIIELMESDVETGQFWYKGEVREW